MNPQSNEQKIIYKLYFQVLRSYGTFLEKTTSLTTLLEKNIKYKLTVDDATYLDYLTKNYPLNNSTTLTGQDKINIYKAYSLLSLKNLQFKEIIGIEVLNKFKKIEITNIIVDLLENNNIKNITTLSEKEKEIIHQQKIGISDLNILEYAYIQSYDNKNAFKNFIYIQKLLPSLKMRTMPISEAFEEMLFKLKDINLFNETYLQHLKNNSNPEIVLRSYRIGEAQRQRSISLYHYKKFKLFTKSEIHHDEFISLPNFFIMVEEINKLKSKYYDFVSDHKHNTFNKTARSNELQLILSDLVEKNYIDFHDIEDFSKFVFEKSYITKQEEKITHFLNEELEKFNIIFFDKLKNEILNDVDIREQRKTKLKI